MEPATLIRPARINRRLSQTASFLHPLAAIPDLSVTGVTLDSRRVVPGDLYAALPGQQFHGASFVEQAVQMGASAILTDPAGAGIVERALAPLLIVEDPRAVLGQISAWVYGYPARAMSVIGITGTDGKTTTATLLEAGLRGAGHKTGLIGTVVTRIDDLELPAIRTTPEAPDLHALLAVMRERGVTAVAMEVSSHALALGRVDAVEFEVSVFTNLGHDHLDFHHDLSSYFDAKASLFTAERSRHALICIDDAWGIRLRDLTQIPAATYSVSEPGTRAWQRADWQAGELQPHGVGWRFQLRGPHVELSMQTALPGVFNVRNAVAATAAAAAIGCDVPAVAAAIGQTRGVPGRMEPIEEGQQYVVLVDYAHTPDAVERALGVGRELAVRNGGQLLTLLGCGGDRDRGKRPLMGESAARLADVVVVTDDNPRSEDPARIRREILAGVAQVPEDLRAQVIELPGREEALRALVQMARPADVAMALGKGHEQGQEIDGVIYPLDDRAVLRAAISGRST